MLVRAWVDGPLAAVVLTTAAYCVGQLIAAPLRGRRIEYDINATHVVMGVSMAGMLISKLSLIGGGVWKAVFTVVVAWYAARVIISSLGRHDRWHRVRHYAGHLLSAGVMLYMYVAPNATPAGMNMVMPAAASGAHPVTLAPVFATVLFGYAILVTGRIPTAGAPTAHCGVRQDSAGRARGMWPHSSARWADGYRPLAPRAGLACDAVMNLAMGVMLIVGL